MSALSSRLNQLVAAHVLTPDQAAELAAAAATGDPDAPDAGRRNRILEVLGYAGGALMLGAIAFLGLAFWPDLTRPQRIGLALASVLVTAGAGALLRRWRSGQVLTQVLFALTAAAAGFAWTVITSDDTMVGTAIVVMAVSAVGVAALRSVGCLLAAWAGAMMLVSVVVLNVIGERYAAVDQGYEPTRDLTIGYFAVTAVFVVVGLLLHRQLNFALAGGAGWSACVTLQFVEPHGEWWALIVGTMVALIAFAGFVITRGYAMAVVGGLILVSAWPTSLFRITESELAAAIGLIVPGTLLILAVVVMSRRQGQPLGLGRTRLT